MKGKLLACALACALLAGCKSESSDTLAPYDARPLSIIRVTQNSTPDIQWLGGRVMAVGVNKGRTAALDSTLVWLTTASGDNIFNYVSYGTNTDTARLRSYGATFADTLTNDTTYTFWIALQSAFSARLDTTSSAVNAFSFVDSIMASMYLVKGTSDGEGGPTNPIVKISLRRFETITGDRFVMTWVPATSAFRQLAVRVGPTGGYDNLLWQITSPTGAADNILPPIALGEVPPGVNEATAWAPTSFKDAPTYCIWMANRNWAGPGTGGVFALRARGYVWFRFAKLP